jgi:hypothetical protein
MGDHPPVTETAGDLPGEQDLGELRLTLGA